jgi:hypothetical protein
MACDGDGLDDTSGFLRSDFTRETYVRLTIVIRDLNRVRVRVRVWV